jgi:hypothetical protein
MRAIERAEPSLIEAAARLYSACHFRRPVVLASRDPIEFARLVRLACAGAPWGVVLFSFTIPIAFILLGVFAASRAERVDAWLAGLLALCGPLVVAMPSLDISARRESRLAHRLSRLSAIVFTLVVAAVVWLVTGSPAWGGIASAVTGAGLVILRLIAAVLGGVPGRLEPWLWQGLRLPITGAPSIRDNVEQRIRSAIAELPPEARLGQPSIASGRLQRDITRALERVVRFSYPVRPLLGLEVDVLGPMAVLRGANAGELPIVLDAALALDRLCRAATVLDGVVVVLSRNVTGVRPVGRASDTAKARAVHAVELLSLPWGFALAVAWLPEALGVRLAAHLIDDEDDPAVRLDAIEQVGSERFFAALGREPIDQGPEGALYMAGSATAPTIMLRVIDLVPHADGDERVHWIPVPPHMSTAHEAVAWTFDKHPDAYRPSLQS